MRRSVLQKSVLIPIIALVFTCFSGLNSATTNSLSPVYTPFPDVPVSHPAFTPITFFENVNVVDGYPDGLFRPANLLNRAEAAKIIYLVNYEVRPSYMDCYNDVFKKDWFSPYVCRGDFINGYGDGYFRPEQNVNFGEALKMMYVTYTGNYPRVYDVLSNGPWYGELIIQAKLDGYIPSIISGSEFINRAQFLDILYKFYQKYGSEPDFPQIKHSVSSSGGNSGRIGSKYKNSGDDDDTDDDDDTGDEDDTGDDDDDTGDEDDTGDDDDDTGDLIITPPNFKVAFFGDASLYDRTQNVYDLVVSEGADMVLHQGDIVNDEDEEYPREWLNMMSGILDTHGTFPYFYSMGNHDEDDWLGHGNYIGYQEILQDRLNALGINYNGLPSELGGKTSFDYNGLFVTLTAPGSGEDFAGDNHAEFLEEELGNSNNLWQICSWHRMMREMQTGSKGDETGWEVYEACRENGAIIANGHEHEYARTHVLSDMSEQTVADNTSPYIIQPGQTFSFHAGTGGKDLRDQDRCEHSDGPPYPLHQDGCAEWAVIYSRESVYYYDSNGDGVDEEYTVQDIIDHEDDDVSDLYFGGVLFIEFYVDGDPRKARAYYKNTAGHILDEFVIYNNRGITGPGDDDDDDTGDEDDDDVPANFVYADGTDLMLDNEEFKFMGANAYGAANSDIYSCGPYGYGDDGMDSEAFLRSMFENFKDNGMNVMRFWAFQAFTDNGTDFSALDRLFEFANEYDIKVIPTLENQWDHCPENIYKDSDWYADGYKHPYGEYDLSYSEYVRRVVTRYKDEPAILMWQMMNEAESDDAQALLNFTRDIARLIKGIDGNHMVNLGTMATGQAGTANQNLVNLHSLTDPELGKLIDILEIHDYDHEEEAWPSSGSNSVARAALVATTLDMPFFIGEAGIQVGGGTTHEERADLFDDKFRELFAHGGAGYLVWRWSNDEYDEGCSTGNCVTVGDPLLNVMRSYLE